MSNRGDLVVRPEADLIGSAVTPQLAAALAAQPAVAQLEASFAIARRAFAQQASDLEAEVHDLQRALEDGRAANVALERCNAALQQEIKEMQIMAKQSATDQQRLATEKAALIDTVRRLNKEVLRLQGFKRNLMRQLQDEDDGEVQAAASTLLSPGKADAAAERLVQDALSGCRLTAIDQTLPQPVLAGEDEDGRDAGGSSWLVSNNGSREAVQQHANSHSLPKYPLALTGARDVTVQQEQQCQLHMQQLRHAQQHEQDHHHQQQQQQQQRRRQQQHPHTPTPDGKEFFRQARARLGTGDFSFFLGSIKELNSGRTTRDDVLARARALFGTANADMYSRFEGLLARHLAA